MTPVGSAGSDSARGQRPANFAPGLPLRSPVRLVLVDDHHLVREALRLVLEQHPGILVVGEASNRAEAFDMLADQEPDMVLLDMTFPDGDGLAMLRDLRARWSGIRILILTMHRDPETVRQAFHAGAAGYVVKGARTSELVDAILAVGRGERYAHSSIAGAIIDDSLQWMEVASPLSVREREVLSRLGAGASAAEIGRLLGISPHTVRRHVANVSAKLGLRGPKALTRYAVENGLIRDE